ncbi:MAG: rhomboid family intramembrane serine protease [Bacteroidales bacterium]|nr:rhomboid family intramembrane serine protease [Bacteroidales bacterium]
MNKSEKKRLRFSLILPVFFLLIMWSVKIIEYSLNLHLYKYGIFPLKFENLTGILFAPFIHGDFDHLFSNTFPFLFLGTALFYFYREYALKVFLLIYFFSGFWVWLAARSAYHIGASGIIYGLASFLFFSGIIHKNRALSAVSLIVVFIYGSMVWGILPIKPEISWEGHLFGAVTGFILTLAFAKKIPEEYIVEPETNDDLSEFSAPDLSDDYYSEVKYHIKKEDEE